MARQETPLRILHVFRSPVGGLFRHVLDLARGQIARGHAVGLLCDSSTGGQRASDALAGLSPQLALGLTRLPMARNPGPGDIGAVLAFRRTLKAERPDIVHAHGSKGGLYGRLPALLSPKRHYATLYTPHGGSFHFTSGRLGHRAFMAVERLLEPATDMFTFESRFILDRFVEQMGRMPRSDHRIVLNGLTEAEFEPVDSGGASFDLLFLGEILAAKGIDTLIDALALLRSRDGLTPSLLLVGAGPHEAMLKAMAGERGIADQLTWSPPGPIRAALPRARVMVMPSRAESLPYVVLETTAAAQPLIATRVGGIPEIYGPEHAASLIPPGDATALADAIKATLALPPATLSARAADLARHVRGQFSVDMMVDGILDACHAALAQRRMSA
jgi:glycosyltransferase involved in cell wall biosynthesis